MLQIKTSCVISSSCEEVEAAFLMKGTEVFWAQVCASTPLQPPLMKTAAYLHLSSTPFPVISGTNTVNSAFSFFLKAEVLLC